MSTLPGRAKGVEFRITDPKGHPRVKHGREQLLPSYIPPETLTELQNARNRQNILLGQMVEEHGVPYGDLHNIVIDAIRDGLFPPLANINFGENGADTTYDVITYIPPINAIHVTHVANGEETEFGVLIDESPDAAFPYYHSYRLADSNQVARSGLYRATQSPLISDK